MLACRWLFTGWETSLESDALGLVLDSAGRHSDRGYLVGWPSVASGAVVSTNTGAAWLMRRKVIISVALHTLAAVAGLLWLLWYFIPTGNVFNGLSTALIILLAGWYVFKTVGMRSTYPTLTSRRLNCHYSTPRAPLYWCVATCWMRCFRKPST